MWLFVPYASPIQRGFQEILSTIFAKISPSVLVHVASMISLYLVPRIPVCDHKRLFLSGHICTLTEKYMCGCKNWTKAHSWRGLARTEREPWLSKFCDAMRRSTRLTSSKLSLSQSCLSAVRPRMMIQTAVGWIVLT